MVRITFLILILGLLPTMGWAAEIQFEGYYRLELESKPIGYVIQRYETDAKEKLIRYAYFLKTNELGGNIQESLKAEARTKEKAEFEPVSFQYTGQIGKELKSLDGVFKKNMMEITKTDGKKSVKETYKIPAGTFLSSFLSYLMLQSGLKTGKKFTYSAVAEEEGNSYKGEAVIKGEEKFAGQTVFRIENNFKGQRFVSFMTPHGEMVGTISPAKKLTLVLVAKSSDATEGFPIPTKSLMLTFGNIPTGQANVLAKAKQAEPAAKATRVAPPRRQRKSNVSICRHSTHRNYSSPDWRLRDDIFAHSFGSGRSGGLDSR